jgi:hypothetical protein
MSKAIESFEEFWPHYVREHRHKLTRQLHFVGTGAAVACVATGLLTRHRWMLLLAPVFALGPGLYSHLVLEKSRPLGLKHPLWSMKANLVMCGKMLAGTMDAEVSMVMGEEVHEAETAKPTIRQNVVADSALN